MAADDQILQRHGREAPRGTVLFREGEAGAEMYVVQRGQVVVSRRTAAGETVLSTLGPGEMLGEMALLAGRPRSATATVVEDALLLVLDGTTFEAMVRARPEIAVRVLRALARRLGEADDRIAALMGQQAAATPPGRG